MEVTHTHRKCVIINADDFGFAAGVTEGILRAHRRGIVTSTTITANMPAAESCLPMLADAPALGVGVHLNVCQGPPLSKAAAVLAGPDGRMNYKAAALILACLRRPKLLDAVEAEFDAQIRWVLDHGIRPTHMDSHRHSHGFGPIFRRAVKLARRYDIPFLRRHREALPGQGWPWAPPGQRRTRTLLNVLGWLNRRRAGNLWVTHGTWGVAHTGFIDAAWLIRAARSAPAGVTEIMVHPGLSDGLDASATRLVESRRRELDALCDPAVRKAFEESNVKLIHYGQLRQPG